MGTVEARSRPLGSFATFNWEQQLGFLSVGVNELFEGVYFVSLS